MDLIVCVGDHCHLSGSEVVVRTFQELLADSDLDSQVTLKGSFCCGQCQPDAGVTIRLEGEFFTTRYEDAEACFQDVITPRIRELLASADGAAGPRS
jgi:NADH:ubiquinone oxidoreductase subunit E